MKAIKEAADDQTIRTLSDHGRVYDNFKQWEKGAILAPDDAYDKYIEESDESKLACVSPFVENFQDLYAKKNRPSTTYVLYDKSGTGKSMDAIALLKDFYLLEENTELQGIMIQPQQEGGDYNMESVASLLKAPNVEGWLNLLLFVLNEKPLTKKPSLLVLDDFFLDEEGRNKRFISQIYSILKRARSERYNIIVVVITKEKHVADCVCSMNGGERIQPMIGRYATKENDVLFKAQCALKLADERRPLANPTWKLLDQRSFS